MNIYIFVTSIFLEEKIITSFLLFGLHYVFIDLLRNKFHV
jgi:hypothetical protein